ncbi:hypothetical protein GCM10009592_13480 [Brachybacterium rhamnosum]
MTAANHRSSWSSETGEDFLGWAARLGVRAVEAELSPWQALNQAVAMTSADVVMILEEDWWPVPGAGDHALATLSRHENGVVYFERRDTVLNELERISDGAVLRSNPRAPANPGLAYAVRRRAFLTLRGYDERASFDRAAGLDLVARLRRSGHLAITLSHLDGIVYHAPELGPTTDQDGVKAASVRRELASFVETDQSIYRNLLEWSVPAASRPPLVSVAVATKDRGSMIADSLYSVLYQTFQDFEIIVVDDGSEDDLAEQAVRQIGDPRIVYVRQEPAGISAARNRAADMTDCHLTAVHDDDDIMLPDRLERGIAALTSGSDASYGSWINFSDLTGEMRGFLGKVGFGADINAFNGQGPGHSTWTLPTWLVRRVRYESRLTASVDHNLASRLDWAGVRWVHTEHFMYLRRVHEKQVTASDGAGQKIGHILTRYGNNLMSSRQQRNTMRDAGKAARYPASASHESLMERYAGFLPDKLVRREVRISRDLINAQFTADLPHRMSYVLEDRNLLTGRAHLEGAALEDVTLADLASFRRSGLLGLQVTATIDIRPENPELDDQDIDLTDVEQQAEDAIDRSVATAAAARVDAVIEEHLRKYPTGSVLVEHGADPYHEFVDEKLLEGAKSARRVVAAGEFGATTCTRIFGYSHRLNALMNLHERSTNSGGSTFALHSREELGGLVQALSPQPIHADPTEVA